MKLRARYEFILTIQSPICTRPKKGQPTIVDLVICVLLAQKVLQRELKLLMNIILIDF